MRALGYNHHDAFSADYIYHYFRPVRGGGGCWRRDGGHRQGGVGGRDAKRLAVG